MAKQNERFAQVVAWTVAVVVGALMFYGVGALFHLNAHNANYWLHHGDGAWFLHVIAILCDVVLSGFVALSAWVVVGNSVANPPKRR